MVTVTISRCGSPNPSLTSQEANGNGVYRPSEVRLGFGLPQRDIVTVTTNVPGPQQPLYGMGRRIVEIIPYVPIATTLRTGVSIFTYCGQMTFGLTGDFAASPDLDVLAHGIEDGISELLKASHRRTRPTRPKARRAGKLGADGQ